MNKYLILLLSAILFACASNNNFDKNSVFKKEYIPLTLPNWLLNIPNGNYEIGISLKYPSKKEELKHAKEFATVNLNRNRNSFVVNKTAKIESGESSNFANFKINVSASVAQIDSILKSLSLVDSYYTGNYFIGLFTSDKNKKKIQAETIKKLSVPQWYKRHGLAFDKKYVYASVKTSSADLINAIRQAMENARYNLARYKTQHISVISTNTYNYNQKAYSMETNTILGNLKTVNIFIIKKISDNSLYSYEVYLRMRGEK